VSYISHGARGQAVSRRVLTEQPGYRGPLPLPPALAMPCWCACARSPRGGSSLRPSIVTFAGIGRTPWCPRILK